jgi:hypothetical protein
MYTSSGVHLPNGGADIFKEEPIPFVIYNNDLRSKY